MFVLLLAWRLAVGRLQRALLNWGWGVRRTIVVDTGPHAQKMAATLQAQRWLGYDVLGLIGSLAEESQAAPILGQVTELPDIAARLSMDVVWLALPAERSSGALELVLATPALPVKWAMARGDLSVSWRLCRPTPCLRA